LSNGYVIEDDLVKRLIKVTIIGLVLLLFTFTVFGTGVALGGSGLLFEPGVVRAADQPPEFDTFWQAWNLVQRHFVDRDTLDATRLTYGAIRGMIAALGDEGHTNFLTPQEAERQQTSISGKFSGIGAQLGLENGLPVIVAPLEDSPAEKAGIRAGDILIEVDDVDVTTWTLNEVVDRVRGEAGTAVELTVLRPDEGKSYEISVVRGQIDTPTASWALLPGTEVALIRLSQFTADATDELTTVIREAQAAGATALIVDVRNNPGGLLEQAIKVTSQFLEGGNVLQQEDASGERQAFPVRRGGIATDIPIVILINRGSASSSEIFAGAIQDHQRGTVVGETTFGTGTVLQPFKLDDGSTLLLGTSQWLTADGRLIRKQGIEPDVTVELAFDTRLLIPDLVDALTVEELLENEDVQVLKALELLDALPELSPAQVTIPTFGR
jgi:carboxyl-terminal processing protease